MRFIRYFSLTERIIWCVSVAAVLTVFLIFDKVNLMYPISAIIGVSYIILNAKGNPFGQVLGLIFSICYGFISYGFGYYGEMLTYLGMTAPMAVWALVAWLRHPYKGNRAEVAVNRIKTAEMLFAFILSVVVAALFYFPLKHFNTANLLPSTLSVMTSFLAVYLTARRSEWFSLAYAANDVVLIVLWSLATLENSSYCSELVCFCAFLVNDIYAFVSWRRMRKRQS